MSEPEITETNEAIAIVGLAGRFPGARTIEEFWHNLRECVESISHFSDEELEASRVDPALIENPRYVRARGVLGDADLFDASFFGYSPRVAALMDPQHRLFLECAWEATERAGYDFDTYPGRVGVFAGASMNTYFLTSVLSEVDLVASVEGLQAAIGNDKDSLTTEVAYRLNLRGPAVTIQSSSSTSLVAVHFACQSLLSYESDMALAGGVSIHFPEKAGYLHHDGSPNSASGHTRAFDADSDGFVAGHGAGVVVLKRLSEALAEGDHIHAVIRGSACNNDGTLKVSYMAPSVEGQVAVVALAQAMADVDPSTIGLAECHGTGTAVGDPIEVRALTEVFRAATDERGFCALGAVKSNIGHLDTAAGVAGLIKATLAVEHGEIPPTVHFEKPNPKLQLEESPFFVNREVVPWRTSGPRRAGVTSLGMGGTNAHVVLEQAPESEPSGSSRPWQLLLLSARTENALEAVTTNLASHLEAHPEQPLADVAYTLQVGRRRLPHRRMLLCRSGEPVSAVLESRDPERVWTALEEARERPVVFLFPGYGGQYVNMARELYESEEEFRSALAQCREVIRDQLDVDLDATLFPPSRETDELRVPFVTELAVLFSVEYALARLWLAWGVRPEAMIGHSIGEYVAACLAGVFPLADALTLVIARGRFMQETAPGAMLAVSLPPNEVEELLDENLWLAAVNAPELSVVSGAPRDVAALEERLSDRGLECRRLHADHAYHSAMMEPALEPFLEVVRRVELKPPEWPYVSNLTGTWIRQSEPTDPSYWGRHLCRTVRFSEGVAELLKDPDRIFLEVGPGRTLSNLVRRHPETRQRLVVESVRHAKDADSDVAFLLRNLGRLWLGGAEVDWTGFQAHERRRRVRLPTYPFERRRHWIEARAGAAPARARSAPADRQVDRARWFYTPRWRQALPAATEATSGSWLIFEDACGIGAELLEVFTTRGESVTRVVPGNGFEQRDNGYFAIGPERPEDYVSLFKALIGLDRLPARIAHLWSILPASSRLDSGAFELSQQMGYHSLISLAQALGKVAGDDPVDLVVVSNDLHTVTGDENGFPEKATLLGPCRVIPQEYPRIRCRSVDLVLPAPESWRWQRLIGQLAAELSGAGDPPVVAYRGPDRWTPAYEQLRLGKAQQPPRRLRREGVYLLTGGLGGLGLEIADYLARSVRARLILVGRSPFPAEEERSGWLESHGADDPVSRSIQKIEGMEQAGAEVQVLQGDVTDPESLRRVLERARERFGSIHGVIHAAGLPSGGTIQLQTPSTAEAVLAPKVAGLRALESLLAADQELDFLVLFSSRTAFLGGFGQADYCAANAYLDAFAHYCAARPMPPTLSINWNAWREVGLRPKMMAELGLEDRPSHDAAASQPVLPDSLDRMEPLAGISTAEGIELFSRMLGADGLAQIVVSPEDLDTVIERARSLTLEAITEDLEAYSASRASGERPNLAAPYVAPRNELERTIAESWQRMLGVDKVGVHDNFFELGGNSLLGVKLISDLNETVDVPLRIVSLYENPTVSALARMIDAGEPEAADAEESLARGARRRARRQRRVQEKSPEA